MANVENKKIISLEIPEDLRKALRVEAFNRDVTVSALIRDILTKELKVSSRKDVNDAVTKYLELLNGRFKKQKDTCNRRIAK